MICRSTRCADFEAELYRMWTRPIRGLLRTIMEKKVLDDELKAEMTKVIKECKEAFVAGASSSGSAG